MSRRRTRVRFPPPPLTHSLSSTHTPLRAPVRETPRSRSLPAEYHPFALLAGGLAGPIHLVTPSPGGTVNGPLDLMQWLHDGVPLTLLLDLLPGDGPDSEAIMRREGGDAGWLSRAQAA